MTTSRPIIFGGWAIPKLMDGSKTQTRRPIKPQPPDGVRIIHANSAWTYELDGGFVGSAKCPYEIGMELWVRETFCSFDDGDTYFKADNPKADMNLAAMEPIKWTSPLYMPRELSRITLKVTDVKVERLKFTSFEDCIAEGFTTKKKCVNGLSNLRTQFERLWDSLYEDKKDYKWAKNCWVWAISFERVK